MRGKNGYFINVSKLVEESIVQVTRDENIPFLCVIVVCFAYGGSMITYSYIYIYMAFKIKKKFS